MKMSFIIVNYRSEQYLKNCIDSIFKYVLDVSFEIIVVNNDKKKLEISFNDNQKNGLSKNIGKTIEVNRNIGFGRGCNLGAKKARGKVLCFLNPDTEIVSNNVKEILNEFDKNKKIGVIGSKIIKKSREVQKWTVGSELTLLKVLKNNIGFIGDEKLWLAKEKQKVAWVTGAVLFVRKNLFEKLKGFDENFFMYFEDIDLCKRARLENFKILYFPKFTVRHLGGGSMKNYAKQKKDYYKSQDYYFEKWFSKKIKFLVWFLRKLTKKH